MAEEKMRKEEIRELRGDTNKAQELWWDLVRGGRYDEALEMIDYMIEAEADGLNIQNIQSYNMNYDLTPAVVKKEKDGEIEFFTTWKPWEYNEKDIVYVAYCYNAGETFFYDGIEEDALTLKEKITNNESIPEELKKKLIQNFILNEEKIRRAMQMDEEELDEDEDFFGILNEGLDSFYYHILTRIFE